MDKIDHKILTLLEEDARQSFAELGERVALSKTPCWQIVLVTQHFGYASPKLADLRYEAFQTLAYGGRGVAESSAPA